MNAYDTTHDNGNTTINSFAPEHLFRIAVRRRFNEVRSIEEPTAYQLTIRWIREKCTAEEQALLDNFYTNYKSVTDCPNYPEIEAISAIVDRFAADMSLH